MKENTFEKYLAKPNKTIKQHNDELLERAKILLDFDYISKETNDNLCRSILYHDSGKANEECQKRIISQPVVFIQM